MKRVEVGEHRARRRVERFLDLGSLLDAGIVIQHLVTTEIILDATERCGKIVCLRIRSYDPEEVAGKFCSQDCLLDPAHRRILLRI